jgi:hypothetical protein
LFHASISIHTLHDFVLVFGVECWYKEATILLKWRHITFVVINYLFFLFFRIYFS